MLEFSEKKKKFNEDLDKITVFMKKVLKCENSVKDIEKIYLRFHCQECENLMNLIHCILIDIEICSKIEYVFKLIIIILNQKGETDLDQIMYIFENMYINFKYMYEHILLEASNN